jgi:hypothetical protein
VIFLGRGVRTKNALLFAFGPGWSVISPAMGRRIVHAREVADSLADASAEKAEERTSKDYSASDWGPVVNAVVRANSRPNPEPDCGPDQNMTGAALMDPRCLMAIPRISLLGRKRPPWSASGKLREYCAIRVD